MNKGTQLNIIPVNRTCNNGATTWPAKVVSTSGSMYLIEFDDPNCPARYTPTNERIIYWLVPGQGALKILPALFSKPYELLLSSAIDLVSVEPVNTNTPFNIYTSGTKQLGGPGSTTNMMTGIGIPIRDTNEYKNSQKAAQETLMHRYKPRLVRNINGGRNDGLGIRNPVETEYKKEYLKFEPGMFISVELLITDLNMETISSVVIHGKIIRKHVDSPIINGMGTVYELDPDLAVGDPADIETYAPVYIGRRKLKYWVCVYKDLNDNKVIVTPGTVEPPEAITDLGLGGSGGTRLAEYLIDEITLSTDSKTSQQYANAPEVPVPGPMNGPITGSVAQPVSTGSTGSASSTGSTSSIGSTGSSLFVPVPVPQQISAVPTATPVSISDKPGVKINPLGLKRTDKGGLALP